MNDVSRKDDIEHRFTYHPPSGNQAERYQHIRDKAKEFAYLMDQFCPASREQENALTYLEHAVFWANAAIARHERPADDERGPSPLNAGRKVVSVETELLQRVKQAAEKASDMPIVGFGNLQRHMNYAIAKAAKRAAELTIGQSKIDRDVKDFCKMFHQLEHIDPNKTNIPLIRALIATYYGPPGVSHVLYRRGSGATTTVLEWLKWQKPKALVIDHQTNYRIWHRHAKIRTFRDSIKGMRPDIVIIEDHTLGQSANVTRRFFDFVHSIPGRCFYLSAYER
ncbi:MAG: hypothetical protein ACK506_16255 [Pirellula sp.]